MGDAEARGDPVGDIPEVMRRWADEEAKALQVFRRAHRCHTTTVGFINGTLPPCEEFDAALEVVNAAWTAYEAARLHGKNDGAAPSRNRREVEDLCVLVIALIDAANALQEIAKNLLVAHLRLQLYEEAHEEFGVVYRRAVELESRSCESSPCPTDVD